MHSSLQVYQKNYVQALYQNMMNLSHHKIAMGLVIGIFFSVLPTFGLGLFFSLLLSWLRKWNLIATFTSSLLSNFLIIPSIYFYDFIVGNWILGQRYAGQIVITPKSLEYLGLEVYLGGIILATISCVLLYLFIHTAARYYPEKKR